MLLGDKERVEEELRCRIRYFYTVYGVVGHTGQVNQE